MLEPFSEHGANYLAELNAGHLYEAEPRLKAFYKELDLINTFNPGIGKRLYAAVVMGYKSNCFD